MTADQAGGGDQAGASNQAGPGEQAPRRRHAGHRRRGGRQQPAEGPILQVNPIDCEAHGLCIELLPELISADPWGYPIIAPGPVPAELLSHAQRAVTACPTLALLLTRPG
jgi:ferredoxin